MVRKTGVASEVSLRPTPPQKANARSATVRECCNCGSLRYRMISVRTLQLSMGHRRGKQENGRLGPTVRVQQRDQGIQFPDTSLLVLVMVWAERATVPRKMCSLEREACIGRQNSVNSLCFPYLERGQGGHQPGEGNGLALCYQTEFLQQRFGDPREKRRTTNRR